MEVEGGWEVGRRECQVNKFILKSPAWSGLARPTERELSQHLVWRKGGRRKGAWIELFSSGNR